MVIMVIIMMMIMMMSIIISTILIIMIIMIVMLTIGMYVIDIWLYRYIDTLFMTITTIIMIFVVIYDY